jgi:hypothetical protein
LKNALSIACTAGFLTIPAMSQDIAACPGPLFECVPPGSGPTPPGVPPDPIFRLVSPSIDTSVDFNRSFGVIKDGSFSVSEGTLELGPEISDYLTRNRDFIDPNGVYLLSPESIDGFAIFGEGVVIGGGALTQ